MGVPWWVYLLIAVSILFKLCYCWIRCTEYCKEDVEEARVHSNPELGRVTAPTPVAGLPPGRYVYVANSDTNSEVPPPPYPGT